MVVKKLKRYYYKLFTTLFFAVVCFIPIVISAASVFEKVYGGPDYDWANSVKQAPDGGYIIAGWTASYGAGNDDVYLIKIDSLGDTLWTRTYGDTADDEGQSVVNASDFGFVIAGYTESYGAGWRDIWLIKTDASGQVLWNKVYGGINSEEANAIQRTTDGGYIIVGYTSSFGVAGSDDIWLLKTNSSGDTLWTRTYGSSYYEEGNAVWQTSDGGYIILGETDSTSGGNDHDIYLIKTNDLGDTLWTKVYTDSADQYAYGIQQTSDGGYIILCETYNVGSGDIWLIKTDASGNIIWQKTYGGLSEDVGVSVMEVPAPDSGFVIGGATFSYGAGGADVYIIKTNNSGDTLWTRTYGGSQNDGAFAMSSARDGGFILAGATESYGIGLPYDNIYIIKTNSEGLLDTFPPVLIGVSPEWASEGDSIFTLTATVKDPSGIDSVYIGFRKGGNTSSFTYREMFYLSDTSYTYTIPEKITLKGIEYYLVFRDKFGNKGRYPPVDSIPNYYSIGVKTTENGECHRDVNGNPLPQPSGTDQNAYRIVSFPIIPTNDNNPASVFSASLGEYDPYKWRVGQFQADNDVYIDDPDIHAIAPGEAYFVIVRDPDQIIYSGAGQTIRSDSIFVKHLNQGWNMIGNPFPFSLPVSAISLSNGDTPVLWAYNGEWSRPSDIQPWQGYVINATSPGINININPTIRGGKTVKMDKWSIRILAYCEKAKDTYNFIGYKKDSKEKWDRNDTKEPPPLGEYISLYFPHPDWNERSGKYATDWRNRKNQTYDFEVETPIKDEVKLKFALNNASTPKEIYLIDKENAKKINIKNIQEYTYNSTGKIHHFSLITGNKEYIRKEINNALKPMKIIAPTFITSTSYKIRYRIAWNSDIALEIYDNIGRKVKTLFAGERKEGTYCSMINNEMPSGVYFIRLKYGKDAVVKKVMVIK